jgi:hypothetical protein
MIRKISAHFIYTNDDGLLKFGVIHLDTDGTVVDIVDTKGVPEEVEHLEFYNGFIIPGFTLLQKDQFPKNWQCIRNNEQHAYTINPLETSKPINGLILLDFNHLEDGFASRLFSLEKSGTIIVIHFSDIKANSQYDYFKHIQVLSQHSNLSFFNLLRWATINPAKAANIDSTHGKIMVNARPGINVVSGLDDQTLKLSKNSSLRVIA